MNDIKCLENLLKSYEQFKDIYNLNSKKEKISDSFEYVKKIFDSYKRVEDLSEKVEKKVKKANNQINNSEKINKLKKYYDYISDNINGIKKDIEKEDASLLFDILEKEVEKEIQDYNEISRLIEIFNDNPEEYGVSNKEKFKKYGKKLEKCLNEYTNLKNKAKKHEKSIFNYVTEKFLKKIEDSKENVLSYIEK